MQGREHLFQVRKKALVHALGSLMDKDPRLRAGGKWSDQNTLAVTGVAATKLRDHPRTRAAGRTPSSAAGSREGVLKLGQTVRRVAGLLERPLTTGTTPSRCRGTRPGGTRRG